MFHLSRPLVWQDETHQGMTLGLRSLWRCKTHQGWTLGLARLWICETHHGQTLGLNEPLEMRDSPWADLGFDEPLEMWDLPRADLGFDEPWWWPDCVLTIVEKRPRGKFYCSPMVGAKCAHRNLELTDVRVYIGKMSSMISHVGLQVPFTRRTKGGTYKAKDSNAQVNKWVSWEYNEKGEIKPDTYRVR